MDVSVDWFFALDSWGDFWWADSEGGGEDGDELKAAENCLDCVTSPQRLKPPLQTRQLSQR
jgi:hypothetical protein